MAKSTRALWGAIVAAGAAGAATAVFFIARPFVSRCLEERETCAQLANGAQQLILVTDSGSRLPQFDSGIYHLELTGYCYRAECDLDLRAPFSIHEVWPDPKLACHGGELVLVGNLRSVTGFLIPRALNQLHARIIRNGVKVYDDDPLEEKACGGDFCFANASK